MAGRLWAASLALLAGTSLSGCVAVAIPALAGSAVVGSRVIDGDGTDAPATIAAAPAPVPVAASSPMPAPAPTSTPAPGLAAAPAPPPPPAAIARPTPMPVPMPGQGAPLAAPAPTPPVPSGSALSGAQSYPDPANPITPGQYSFARFVRYSQAMALQAGAGEPQLSAVLSDPVALDGQRRQCAASEQQIALIDLDPAGGLFSPPANPSNQTGLALGLALLRNAGVEIAWLSDLPVEQSGAVRTALERSGLDPRGEDIIALRRDETNSKQERKQNLAGIACIIAIAGDERPDFDERFKYLRTPEAGAGLEPVIGNGWFLIEPLIGS